MKKPDLSRIHGIVFDLDDTLYPQKEFKRSGFRAVSSWVAAQFEIDQRSILSELEDILSEYGASYPEMFNRLAERLGLKAEDVPEMVQVFIAHEPRISCYTGVTELLSKLRPDYRLGILTDGRYAVQLKKIKALGLEKMVDEILCSDQIGLEKPAPELYHWFEKKFNLPGKHLMYIGDNPEKDFYGANKRGWYTISVLSGEKKVNGFTEMYNSAYTIPSIFELGCLTAHGRKMT